MSKLRIAPVGTCRIHTPLRNGVSQYPITPILGRNYGFVHTSSEALQQLRFMFGKINIPVYIEKLIFRPSIPAKFHEKPYVPADLYMVEISSRKLLTIDNYPIQLNYASRYFSDFFSDKSRSKIFWTMATEDRLVERRKLFAQDPAFQRLCASDQELLTRIQRKELQDSDIERDMVEIEKIIKGKKLLFVTHVNAKTPDNLLIKQRQSLINIVSAVAKKIALPCYDPSPLMRKLGQINAMANNGLDLTHYTDIFSQQLCAEWCKLILLPPTKSASRQNDIIATPAKTDAELSNIKIAWASGRQLEASRQLRQILRDNPDRHDCQILLGEMQYELGDYEGTIAHLEAVRNETGPNEKYDVVLMRAHFSIGSYIRSRLYATALLSDEVETPEIVRISAISSTHLKYFEAALNDWKRLFYLSDEDKVEAASAVLEILKAAGDSDATLRWASYVLETLPTDRPSFLVLWKHRLEIADRMGLLELVQQPVKFDETEALDLIQHTAQQGFAMPAAMLAIAHGLASSKEPRATKWISEIADEWLDRGLDSLNSGKLLEGADCIQASWQIHSIGKSEIRARRSLEQKMRIETRKAFNAKDYDAVVRITAIAHQTLTKFPELDSFLGRAADALGDIQTALIYLKKATYEKGASINAQIYLARVASRNEKYSEAIDAYAEILQGKLADEWARDEASRQLTKLHSRLIRSARDLLARAEYDQAWALLDRMGKTNPTSEVVPREKKRVLAVLRANVKVLSTNNATDRLSWGELILRLDPHDEVGLKAASVGAMRMHQFPKALQYLQTLRENSKDSAQIDVNIQKCLLWIDRANKKKFATVQIV